MPPPTSDGGKLRHPSRSDLLQCSEKLWAFQSSDHWWSRSYGRRVGLEITDGAACSHDRCSSQGQQKLSKNTAKLFLCLSLHDGFNKWVSRVDVVRGEHTQYTLKTSTRKGVGRRRRLLSAAPLALEVARVLLESAWKKKQSHHLLPLLIPQIKVSEWGNTTTIATDGCSMMKLHVQVYFYNFEVSPDEIFNDHLATCFFSLSPVGTHQWITRGNYDFLRNAL